MAAGRIADAACAPGLPVLEIGPGLGALTKALAARAPRVTAVELDAAMVGALSQEFVGSTAPDIVHADFLKFDLEGYAKARTHTARQAICRIMTTPICMKLLTCSGLPERMVLMMQKEAAARFAAKAGTKLYGPLAILAQLYYDCDTPETLTPADYYPQPEVESAVVVCTRNKTFRRFRSCPDCWTRRLQ